MWYVWQKENIFFYTEPGFADHKWIVSGANLILLIAGMIGMVFGWKSSSNPRAKWVFLSFVGTIAYGTFAFCFSHAEYRLTIPFYPVVIALAVLGFIRVGEFGKRKP
jgi:CHASE2 domain-containing sensor protein